MGVSTTEEKLRTYARCSRMLAWKVDLKALILGC
jgi:hypothetical protein